MMQKNGADLAGVDCSAFFGHVSRRQWLSRAGNMAGVAVVAGAALLCMAFARPAIAAGAAAADPAPAKEAVLMVLGDSISAEYGLARGQGWVELLKRKLNAEGLNVQTINASISGETTAGGRSRMPALLKANQPTHVIVELGGNDALRGLPLQSTRANLTAIISDAKKADAKVLLLGIQVPPNYGHRYTQEFAATFETVAQEQQVALMPFFLEPISAPADLEKYFQSDRIHPNAAAQPVMLDAVWPAVEKLLAD